MKNSFREYYGLNSSELNKLWKEGIIVFDTNVLLSLYRRSEDVRNDFISLIKNLKDRIWLPNQVGFEYHERRLEEAMRPIEALQGLMTKIQKFEKDIIQEYGNNPYLDIKKIEKAFKSFSSRIDKLTQASQSLCPDFLHEDSILSELTDLFDGKLGREYQEKTLSEIYGMGNERYSKKIPPGYKDTRKHDGDRHRFGDLIIWLQIIEHAKAKEKDILFVTDDKKEDWWEEYKDNKIGPRHELIREFRIGTNNRLIWFYTLDRFLEYAKSKAGIPVKPKTIEEVKRPTIDWANFQGSLPGQVSIEEHWPFASLGESDSINIGINPYFASKYGNIGLPYSEGPSDLRKEEWMKYLGLTEKGYPFIEGIIDSDSKEYGGSASKDNSKPEPDDTDNELNQDNN